ncbi:MAG: glycosyltransferase [Candidatus Binatia bacterium]
MTARSSTSACSRCSQRCADWRCLVVVKPSDRDHFASELAEVLRDPRLRLLDNRGRALAGAINTGMRAADTEFVALILGDDLWAPEAVEVLTRAIAAFPEVDFFHSARRVIDDAGAPISSVYPSRETFTLRRLRARASPVKHLLCWRRALGLAVGGIDESINSVGPDDYDFPWVMASAARASRRSPSACTGTATIAPAFA